MAVIYRITNMITNDYYIGSAESFERRKWHHTYDLRRGAHKNPRMQAAWNKYGSEAFVFEVLEEIPDGRATFDVENTYLMKCVGQPDCYNVNVDAYVPRLGIPHREDSKQKISAAVQQALTEGRAGRFIPTEETRAKMSESARGNTNAKGYKRTDAEREAIRQRTLGNQHFLGKQHTEETKDALRRRLSARLPDGSTREFVGVSAAGVELGVSYPMLVRAAQSGKPVAKGLLAGWFFFYSDSPTQAPHIPDEFASLPRSRAQAKAEGAPRYFTGLPCEKGHVSPRATKGECIACRRENEAAARAAKKAAVDTEKPA